MITLMKDDYKTPLVFHMRSGENFVPLVASKVFFSFVAKATNTQVGGGECKVVDEKAGMVQYDWKEGDLGIVGEYYGVPRVELAQGARREGIPIEFKIVE